MVDISLFDNKLRTDLTFDSHLEGEYSVLDRLDTIPIRNVRNLLNRWFDKYPSEHKENLKKRFIDSAFSPAFYELFIHEFFTNLGFTLHVEPELAKTSKRIDFLAVKGDFKVYIEVKESKDSERDSVSHEKLKGSIYDSINSIRCESYILHIETVDLTSGRQPKLSLVKEFLQRKIDELDYNEVLRDSKLGSFPIIEFENADLKLQVKIKPLIKESTDPEIPNIGFYPIGIRTKGIESSMRKAIEKKSRRYGDLDVPFIICVNTTRSLEFSKHAALDIIYGPMRMPLDKEQESFRLSDGLYGAEKAPKCTSISGVFMTGVNLANLSTSEYIFSKHPNSKNPICFEKFGLKYFFNQDGKIWSTKGPQMRDVLDIPETYLSVI